VNGQEITAFNTNEISVSTIPAEVEIYY